jgi:type IX secretion system PorP/SprF family membrane protein
MHRIIYTLSILLLFSALVEKVSAQQLPQISQYMENDYVINPAVAGTEQYFDVNFMSRQQWVGITDAPRTFTLSLAAPMKNEKMGLGGYIYADNAGPTRRTGFQLSYSYILTLNESLKLSLAASGGLQQFAIDGSQITLTNSDDPALYGEKRADLLFDAKFGAYLYHEDFYVGVTFPQLLQNQLDLYDSNNSISRLEDHYYLTAGYKYEINETFTVEPSVMVKYTQPVPLKIDASARVFYQNMIWLGASYRNNDAIVAMAGYEYQETLSIGYSYDFTTSNLQNYSSGTHEIVLGFKFNQ